MFAPSEESEGAHSHPRREKGEMSGGKSFLVLVVSMCHPLHRYVKRITGFPDRNYPHTLCGSTGGNTLSAELKARK